MRQYKVFSRYGDFTVKKRFWLIFWITEKDIFNEKPLVFYTIKKANDYIAEQENLISKKKLIQLINEYHIKQRNIPRNKTELDLTTVNKVMEFVRTTIKETNI